MVTEKQIDRLLKGQLYHALARELLAARPEASARLEKRLSAGANAGLPEALVALSIVRLDEVGIGYGNLSSRLLRGLLLLQREDGSFGDILSTTLAICALRTSSGNGIALDAAVRHLADAQLPDGFWPIRAGEMKGDAFTTAFVLYALANDADVVQAARMSDAALWFQQRLNTIDDPEAVRLWDRSLTRCRNLLMRAGKAQSSRTVRTDGGARAPLFHKRSGMGQPN